MFSQKEAVYRATQVVLKRHHLEFEDGQDIREAMGKDRGELRREIRDLVFEAMQAGRVNFGDRPSNEDRRTNDAEMMRYATSLVSNWFRKDKRLNGGQRYVPSRSRDGRPSRHRAQGDERIARLRAALEIAEDNELRDKLQEAIDEREDEVSFEHDLAERIKSGKPPHKFDEEMEGQEKQGEGGDETEQEEQKDESEESQPEESAEDYFNRLVERESKKGAA